MNFTKQIVYVNVDAIVNRVWIYYTICIICIHTLIM